MSTDRDMRAAMVSDQYGPDVLDQLLELAPLIAANRSGAWRRAVAAVLDGDSGTLVLHVPGLSATPPAVTWLSSGWRVFAEMTEVDGTD